jgi:hypothetical protein
MKTEDFLHMPIPVSMFTAVCALLGGTSVAALNVPQTRGPSTADKSASEPQPDAPQLQPQGGGEPAGGGSTDTGEIDAHGHPWSAALHASTKGKTKDGLWRMKVGVSRPAPAPGFPKEGGAATGTASSGAGSAGGGSATNGNAGSAGGEGEDEFAAFRAAADKSNAGDAAAAANIPARKWTDADLGALCNQAAVKLGDPAPIKAVIAEFVPGGQVPHSRNIPDDKREAFAQAVEAKAGITFAG